MENRVTLIGDVVSAPRESHKSNGKKFYKFFIGVERRSGVADILPVLFDEKSAIQESAERYMSVGR